MDNPLFIRIPIAVFALTLTSFLGALGGCASTPAPTGQRAVAEAAVEQASTGSTREKEQAQVDAQLAEMRAQSARSLKAAQESQAAAERDRTRLAMRAQEGLFE